jgi:hypothetical protein
MTSAPRRDPRSRGTGPHEGWPVGDSDNDCRLDVLIGNNGCAPLLLRNNSGTGNHWLGLKLGGVNYNRDAIGAEIRWSVNGVIRSRLRNGGGSYLSSHDPREILGAGSAVKIDWVEIVWPRPSGKAQRLVSPPIDRYLHVREEA